MQALAGVFRAWMGDVDNLVVCPFKYTCKDTTCRHRGPHEYNKVPGGGCNINCNHAYGPCQPFTEPLRKYGIRYIRLNKGRSP